MRKMVERITRALEAEGIHDAAELAAIVVAEGHARAIARIRAKQAAEEDVRNRRDL